MGHPLNARVAIAFEKIFPMIEHDYERNDDTRWPPTPPLRYEDTPGCTVRRLLET